MRILLVASFALLSACAAHRRPEPTAGPPATHTARPATPAQATSAAPTVLTVPVAADGSYDWPPVPPLGKVKGGVVFNFVQGPQTNTNTGKKGQSLGEGATSIERPRGPTATGSSTAKDQSNSGVSSDVTGDNNQPQLTSTQSGKKTLGQTIADNLTGPVGWVIGALALGVVVYGIYYFWWLIPRRKQRADTTQA